jgi:hypothetical protein
MSGKQIKLFPIDGTRGGLTTAEITNWTGHVLSAGRSDLADLRKRDEAQRTVPTSCWVTTKLRSAIPAAISTATNVVPLDRKARQRCCRIGSPLTLSFRSRLGRRFSGATI